MPCSGRSIATIAKPAAATASAISTMVARSSVMPCWYTTTGQPFAGFGIVRGTEMSTGTVRSCGLCRHRVKACEIPLEQRVRKWCRWRRRRAPELLQRFAPVTTIRRRDRRRQVVRNGDRCEVDVGKITCRWPEQRRKNRPVDRLARATRRLVVAGSTAPAGK